MNAVTLSYRSRRLAITCIALSFATHVAAVIFLYFNPFLLQSPLKSLFGITTTTPTLLSIDEEDPPGLLKEKNQILEEVFEQIVILPPHFQQFYDLIELPKGIALAPHLEETMPLLPQEPFLPDLVSSEKDFALSPASDLPDREEYPISPLLLAEEIETPFASQLQIDPKPIVAAAPLVAVPVGQGKYEDLIAISDYSLEPTFEADYSLNLSPQFPAPNSLKIGEDLELKTDIAPLAAEVKTQDLKLEDDKVRSTLFIPKSAQVSPEAREVKIANSPSFLEQYDFQEMAMASEWNNDFDVQVHFLPDPEGQGYIFSLAVQPNGDLSSYSLRQNLYFILDRSSSVQKHRFAVFKRAVLKALASMQQGDTFNIIVMDKKLVPFSPQSRPVTLKNIQAAEDFLDKEEAGGLFSSGEIYTALEKILSMIPENEEIHTAILLTDGKSSLSPERKQKALKKWTEKNNGKLALYTAAIGRNNDIVALDMLSAVSGGKLLYSDTHASFPRKLAKLVLDLKDPIAKDLMITAIPHHPHSYIELFAAGSHLPALYSHQPYLLFGKIDDPCAFDLVFQGRHRDQWIVIKKNISFVEGQKGDKTLESHWSAQHANCCYAKFLQEGKAAHLKEAKEILKKSRHEIAFE